MTKHEKVLKGLECCLKSWNGACDPECPYNYECRMSAEVFQIVMRDALELLKDEPLPVLNVEKFNCYHGNCPGCGKRIHYKNTNYCPYCGKRVKWE